MSLRARLLAGLILVAALGLVVADVVVYGQVQVFLTNQVDQQLVTTMNPLLHQLESSSFDGGGFGGNLGFQQDTPDGTWGAVIYGKGTVVPGSEVFPAALAPAPHIPANAVESTDASSSTVQTVLGTGSALHLTESALGEPSFRYRLLLVAFNLNSSTLNSTIRAAAVVAIPLTSVDAALHHLVGIDIIASAAVLALLALLGWLVVHLGMRPLVEIEETAGAIAAGDLARRVARDEQATEIGRLGASLNAMLGQIEHAFGEQRASENRLRQFIADASHELRTPVTSIRGYAELFRRGAVQRPEDLSQAMRRIEDESIRMGVLVDDLLLLARLDEGRDVEQRVVDLVAVATDAAADGQVVAPDRTITLDGPSPVSVLGDEQQLLQIVTNLVQNALRYTPKGTPVTVGVHASEQWAVLSVADEGPGISAEHAEHIFERFYRADASRTRDSGGTGLGLSIVKSIAEAHGGRARVVTAPGAGATFLVELPLYCAGAPADPTAAAAADAAATPSNSSAQIEEMARVVEAPDRPQLPGDDEAGDRGVVDGDERKRPSVRSSGEH